MNHLSIKLLRKKVFYQIKTLCVEGCDFILTCYPPTANLLVNRGSLQDHS